MLNFMRGGDQMSVSNASLFIEDQSSLDNLIFFVN